MTSSKASPLRARDGKIHLFICQRDNCGTVRRALFMQYVMAASSSLSWTYTGFRFVHLDLREDKYISSTNVEDYEVKGRLYNHIFALMYKFKFSPLNLELE